jgi:hypothetical protein
VNRAQIRFNDLANRAQKFSSTSESGNGRQGRHQAWMKGYVGQMQQQIDFKNMQVINQINGIWKLGVVQQMWGVLGNTLMYFPDT